MCWYLFLVYLCLYYAFIWHVSSFFGVLSRPPCVLAISIYLTDAFAGFLQPHRCFCGVSSCTYVFRIDCCVSVYSDIWGLYLVWLIPFSLQVFLCILPLSIDFSPIFSPFRSVEAVFIPHTLSNVVYRFQGLSIRSAISRYTEYAHSAAPTELTRETESARDWQKPTEADGSRQKLTEADEGLWHWQSRRAASSRRRSRRWETGCVLVIFRAFFISFLASFIHFRFVLFSFRAIFIDVIDIFSLFVIQWGYIPRISSWLYWDLFLITPLLTSAITSAITSTRSDYQCLPSIERMSQELGPPA